MNEIALRLAAHFFDRPLIQNQYRSAFVEAMMEPHLASRGWRHIGDNWAGWDFQHAAGTRLEVKQSAAWQTWGPVKPAAPNLFRKGYSGAFDIAPRTGWYDESGVAWTEQVGRPAHVYVFAWNGQVGDAADQSDPAQWEFFIVPKTTLPAQKTLALSRVRAIAGRPFRGPEHCAEGLMAYVTPAT